MNFLIDSMMPEISISSELKSWCPKLRLGCIEANVFVAGSGDGLLSEIKERLEFIQRSLTIEEISKIPAIESSRKAYKACGKDPARYRLSAEVLLRRVVSDKGFYQISNVVDQFLMTLIDFGNSDQLEESKEMAVRLLKEYCRATHIIQYNIT